MGKSRKRSARTKTKNTHSRTIWAGVEREVKRQEFDNKAKEAKDPKAEPVPESTASSSTDKAPQAESVKVEPESSEQCKGTYHWV